MKTGGKAYFEKILKNWKNAVLPSSKEETQIYQTWLDKFGTTGLTHPLTSLRDMLEDVAGVPKRKDRRD